MWATKELNVCPLTQIFMGCKLCIWNSGYAEVNNNLKKKKVLLVLTKQRSYLLFPSPEQGPITVLVVLQFSGISHLHAGSPCWPPALAELNTACFWGKVKRGGDVCAGEIWTPDGTWLMWSPSPFSSPPPPPSKYSDLKPSEIWKWELLFVRSLDIGSVIA